jgi:hypothetical protein
MTQPVKPHFHLLIQENGRARIVLEPIDDHMEQAFKRSIIFDLKEGTTAAEAQSMVAYLRANLIAVSEVG